MTEPILCPAGTPELYPGQAAQLARRASRNAAMSAANTEPLPGPLLDAFGGVPQSIAGLTVRPLVHFDFVILRKLESPLLRQLQSAGGDTSKPATEFSDEQGYEMVFQFTRPAREAAAVLAKGKEEFRRRALEEIGMTLGPVEVALLIKAVEREFVRAFSTAVQYGVAAGIDGTVFTMPPADPTTASAGGSTTSVS